MTAPPQRYVVLLRAINVGGRNKVPMAWLRELCAELGFADVATYVQSGNVVLTSDRSPADVAQALEDAIEAALGFRPAAVIRTGEQLAAARAAHPFEVHEPKMSAIGFLAGPAHDDWEARLPPADELAPDVVALVGDELHLRYDPVRGQHGSTLTGARLERALGVQATVRNMRTVDAVVGLL